MTITKGKTRHKRLLKEKGYSYRRAAPLLGVHFTHLDRVLQGHRESASLLRRIEELPARKEVRA